MSRRLNIHQARNWIYYAAYLTLFIIAIAIFVDAPWNTARKWVAIASIILMIAIYAFDPRPRPRTLRALVRSRFRLCPHCHYDVSALDAARSTSAANASAPPTDHAASSITCPECGRSVSIADIRRHWRIDWGYSRSPRAASRR